MGGLASSTILVLTLTPALYMLFERYRAFVFGTVGAVLGFLVGGVYLGLPRTWSSGRVRRVRHRDA